MLADANVATGRLPVPKYWFQINSNNMIERPLVEDKLKFNKHSDAKYFATGETERLATRS